MSKPTLGVIGTGDFAAYLIGALRKGGHDGRILLSPHNPAKAQAMAIRHGCEVAADEPGMIGEADWILLAIRPEQLQEALARLFLRPGQVVISAVAGATVARLRASLGQGVSVVRIMPSSYIDTVSQGIIPIYPASAAVESVLEAAGRIVAFDTEDQFELALAGACISGWMYRFIETLEGWFVERGLSPAQARLMAAGNIAGAASHAMVHQDVPLAGISDAIATEGTYTKAGLDLLLEKEAAAPWVEALDIVYGRLKA